MLQGVWVIGGSADATGRLASHGIFAHRLQDNTDSKAEVWYLCASVKSVVEDRFLVRDSSGEGPHII